MSPAPAARPGTAVRRSTWITLALVLGCLLLAAAWWVGRASSSTSAGVGGAGGAAGGGAAGIPSAVASASGSGSGSGSRGTAAKPSSTPTSGLPTIPESTLPSQARHTLSLIRSGGPFPYRQDGVTFQNREGHLPTRANGYYHEYTVDTPGSPDRGPRRIIAGRNGDLYWTADHYDHFQQILEGR